MQPPLISATVARQALPNDQRDQIFRDLRASVITSAESPSTPSEESNQLFIEESVSQIIDEFEMVARREL